jgi:23S rRNA pseudouridine2605 synthase
MANRPPPRGQRPGHHGRGPKPGGDRHGGPPRRPPERRPVEARDTSPQPDDHGAPERLQKVLAHAGVGSRRACEEMILQGRVTIDGQVARELGTRVGPHAKIAVDGEPIRIERPVYFAVHKPKGYVCTNNDPAGRPRVVDLLPEVPERVYAVGRLDEQSTGLMLLTNDGELANKLAHPKYGVEKVYRLVVAGEPGRELFDKLVEGVWLAEGKVRAKRVRPVARRGQATVLEMTLAEGKNREIRRMMAQFGHKVMSLTRIAVGPVALKGLGVGEARPLTGREIDLLRKVAAGLYVPAPRAPDRRPRIPRGGSAPIADQTDDTGEAHARHSPPARGGHPRSQKPTGRVQGTQGPRPQQPPHRSQRPAQAGPPPPAPSRPGAAPTRPSTPPPTASRRPGAASTRPFTPPPPPPPAPKRGRPARDASGDEGPRRIIIGLTPEPRPGQAGPPGARRSRPAPRRSPRSALGVKRPKRPEPGDGNEKP